MCTAVLVNSSTVEQLTARVLLFRSADCRNGARAWGMHTPPLALT